MKLGVMLEGQEGLTWDLWRQIMARVEELGFESLWRSDHFMSIVDSHRDVLETWVALTLTAVETTRLRFGSLVCPMTFRHPSLLAQMAASLKRKVKETSTASGKSAFLFERRRLHPDVFIALLKRRAREA